MAANGDCRKRWAVAAIFDPDDQRILKTSIAPGGEETLTVEPKRKFRGMVWGFGMTNGTVKRMEGIPSSFAFHPEGVATDAGDSQQRH